MFIVCYLPAISHLSLCICCLLSNFCARRLQNQKHWRKIPQANTLRRPSSLDATPLHQVHWLETIISSVRFVETQNNYLPLLRRPHHHLHLHHHRSSSASFVSWMRILFQTVKEFSFQASSASWWCGLVARSARDRGHWFNWFDLNIFYTNFRLNEVWRHTNGTRRSSDEMKDSGAEWIIRRRAKRHIDTLMFIHSKNFWCILAKWIWGRAKQEENTARRAQLGFFSAPRLSVPRVVLFAACVRLARNDKVKHAPI